MTLQKITLFLTNLTLCLTSCMTNASKEKALINSLPNDTTQYFITSTKELKSNYIPDSVFNMTNITVLLVGGSDCDLGISSDDTKDTVGCWMIKEIPKRIGQLKKLVELTLPLNAIQKIPEEIKELQNLKTIDLSENKGLTNINNITTLTNLETLNLFGCSLTSLPKDIGKLKKLKQLGLTGNNLFDAEIKRLQNVLPNCDIIYRQ